MRWDKVTSLMDHCRYYKGEKECPYTMDEAIAWGAEKFYVENFREGSIIFDFLSEYQRMELSSFQMLDGVPLTLKAVLYNRFEHYNEAGPEEFKKWYMRVYK